MNGQLDLIKTSSVVSLLPYTLRRYARIPSQWKSRHSPASPPISISTSRGRALLECRAMKTMARLLPILLTFALVCFALVQNAQAVNPPPDGGYPGEKYGRRHARTFQPSRRRVQHGRWLAGTAKQYRSVVQHRCRRGRALFQQR